MYRPNFNPISCILLILYPLKFEIDETDSYWRLLPAHIFGVSDDPSHVILQFYSIAEATKDDVKDIKEYGLFFVITDKKYKIGDFNLVKDHGIFAFIPTENHHNTLM